MRFALLINGFEFLKVHSKKDPGMIPMAFKSIGFDSYLIIGKMLDLNYIETNDVNVLETGITEEEKGKIGSIIHETFKIISYLNAINPDILLEYKHSHSFIYVAFYIKIKSILSRHRIRTVFKMDTDGTYISKLNRLGKIINFFYFNLYAKIFDLIIVESNCGYDNIAKMLWKAKKLTVLPNSAKLDNLKCYPPFKRGRTILSVGRITYIKGFDILIKAFGEINKDHPDWKLKIIGFLEDSAYYDKLVKMIADFNISDKVSIILNADDNVLEEEYASSSIFCLFSRYEGFSIGRLEALASGLYVITSEAGCGRDFIKYGAKVVPIDDLSSSIKELQMAINIIEKGNWEFKQAPLPTYVDIVNQLLEELKIY